MAREMINLLTTIGALRERRNKMATEYALQLQRLDDAISAIGKINEACTFCGGKGYRLRERVCAEDDRPNPDDPRDRITCKPCHGTGWKHWIDDEGVERSANNYNELLGE